MKPDIETIRNGIASTINAHVGMHLHAYGAVEDVAQLPAVAIEPEDAEYDGAFSNGMQTWDFNLFVVVSRNDAKAAQRTLDTLISGSGENSIRYALSCDPTLGGLPVNARVYKMQSYGGSFVWYGVKHVGAILKVKVLV
jgi:hypothetical protein